MRKKDREITDKNVLESIIHQSTVCRLAMNNSDYPYIVPLCFGYRDNTLYFHSAREGKKLDIIRRDNKVCFEFDIDHSLLKSDTPCKWSMAYRSVIGFGKASLIDESAAKRRALDIIMQHYRGTASAYNEAALNAMVIIKVEIENMTGKHLKRDF